MVGDPRSENQHLLLIFAPPKVVAEVGMTLGMMNTNIELANLEVPRSIEKHMGAADGFKVGDLSKISCFRSF